MSVIEHWIAYDVKREIGPTILREKWRADLFRADERNRVDGPFVPAEQLAGAVSLLRRWLDADDEAERDWSDERQAHLDGVVAEVRAYLGGQ